MTKPDSPSLNKKIIQYGQAVLNAESDQKGDALLAFFQLLSFEWNDERIVENYLEKNELSDALSSSTVIDAFYKKIENKLDVILPKIIAADEPISYLWTILINIIRDLRKPKFEATANDLKLHYADSNPVDEYDRRIDFEKRIADLPIEDRLLLHLEKGLAHLPSQYREVLCRLRNLRWDEIYELAPEPKSASFEIEEELRKRNKMYIRCCNEIKRIESVIDKRGGEVIPLDEKPPAFSGTPSWKALYKCSIDELRAYLHLKRQHEQRHAQSLRETRKKRSASVYTYLSIAIILSEISADASDKEKIQAEDRIRKRLKKLKRLMND